MRKTAFAGLVTVTTLLIGATLASSGAMAAGQLPDPKVCHDAKNPPKDPVTRGGCIVMDRTLGNCTACHQVAGAAAYGNVAPPLVSMQSRFPDKARLRAQIEDASKFNPKTVMPPFGRNDILTQQEINDVVEFILTL